MSVAEAMVDALGGLPAWIVIVIISMMPFIELRGALPIAILVFNMNIYAAFLICVAANMFPVPFILIFFKRIEKWLRRYPRIERLMDRIFERTRIKASSKINKYKTIGLMLFVGIPLPVTGAWTGSLIAYLFDLDIKKSFWAIFAGVIIAGTVILIVSFWFKVSFL